MDKSQKKPKKILIIILSGVGAFVLIVGLLIAIPGIIREKNKSAKDENSQNVLSSLFDIYDPSKVSDTYLVGTDYFTGDFLEMAPTVIVKVRRDKQLEAEFERYLSNGERYSDTLLFKLTDEQYKDIEKNIDLKKLYNLDPEELDPKDVCDGGSSWLFIYDKEDGVYKRCGGFCPTNKDFNAMCYAIYRNLPQEFLDYCDRYKTAWQREQDFHPYILSLPKYDAKYGVFLDYDGDLSELSEYDYLVIDAQYHTAEEIDAFKRARYGNCIYSYIDIGSIENFRDYYDRFEDLALGDYENWEEEKWVDVSDERWQRFILEELAPALLEKGVDGFFVDNCDVYYNYPTDEILEGLANIMKGLRRMGVSVVINGGDAFLNAYTEKIGPWTDVITGINQECVYTGIDWDENTLVPAEDEDKEYFTEYIEKYGDQGAYIFVIEYVEDTPDNEELREDIKKYCREHNYLYYISDSINLD